MLSVAIGSASAADSCRPTEDELYALRAELRAMRRDHGAPVLTAADAPYCADTLRAIAKNDPLLGVRVLDAAPGEAEGAVEAAIARQDAACGAVLTPGPGGGGALIPIGACGSRTRPERRVFTASLWALDGVSLRWNEAITPGFSLLVDAAIRAPSLPIAGPDLAADLTRSWRVLVGADVSKRDLRGTYFGLRGGVQHVEVDGEIEASTVAQGALGRRWIGRFGVVQGGVGGRAWMPTGDNIGHRGLSLGPLAELRIGLP